MVGCSCVLSSCNGERRLSNYPGVVRLFVGHLKRDYHCSLLLFNIRTIHCENRTSYKLKNTYQTPFKIGLDPTLRRAYYCENQIGAYIGSRERLFILHRCLYWNRSFSRKINRSMARCFHLKISCLNKTSLGWRKLHLLRNPPTGEHVCGFRCTVNMYDVLSRFSIEWIRWDMQNSVGGLITTISRPYPVMHTTYIEPLVNRLEVVIHPGFVIVYCLY